MKVLTVIATMGTGGAEAIVTALVTAADTQGEQACVASAGGWRSELLAEAGVEQLSIPLATRRVRELGLAVLRLRRWIAEHGPDVIHAHNVKASAVAALARGSSGIPIVTTLHGLAGYAGAARVLARCSDLVVAVSEHVAAELCAHRYPAARLRVIENAITPLPVHERSRARRRLSIPDASRVVVSLARFAPQKRHDLLIEAWRSTRADAVLLLAGDGPTRVDVERSVVAAGLAQRVHLLGERQDPDWLLAAADIAVLSTDWEGLPVSLLEAMSVGVPVVASRVGGVAEVLADAACLVEPGSAGALASGLNALLDDASARAELAARGRTLVASRFDPQRMFAAYRQLYDGLCGSGVGGAQ
ncbi:MAG TPA: glycosyltransferase [Jatrophihabitantaceae bacterium]|nr:glycosyltransferase [Jatrophihabitantaceae bacterium]